MSAAQKQIPTSKLLQILQNCKQIPKDDRLALRKFLKQGDESLSTILQDFNNKKLQVRLRKYLQKCKENKKDYTRDPQVPNRQMTHADLKDKLKTNETPNIKRQAAHSLDKAYSNNLRASQQIKQFKQQLDEYRSLRSSLSSTQLMKSTSKTLSNIANITKSPQQDKLQKMNLSNWASNHKYLVESQSYLKQVQDKQRQNIFTSSQLLNWKPSSSLKPQSLQSATYLAPSTSQQSSSLSLTSSNWQSQSSTIQSLIPSSSLLSSTILPVTFTPTPFEQLQSLSSIFGKIRQSVVNGSTINIDTGVCSTSTTFNNNNGDNLLSNEIFGNCKNVIDNKQNEYEKNVCEFKCSLIKFYAQDIFQYIAGLHFPFTINDRSVFLPYRQFVLEVQKYLNSHGENIKVIKQNEIKIPVFQPFTNDYQSVTLKTLGLFLNKYCLHRNNQIKSIFIVLDALETGITIQRFKKINAWKGEQLIESFQKLVRKWGDMNTISYWQMFRIKNQKEYLNFISLYSKL